MIYLLLITGLKNKVLQSSLGPIIVYVNSDLMDGIQYIIVKLSILNPSCDWESTNDAH